MDVIWQWNGNPHKSPTARMFMGVPKNKNGTGYRKLEPNDAPLECPYCDNSLVYKYPHSHSLAEKEAVNG